MIQVAVTSDSNHHGKACALPVTCGWGGGPFTRAGKGWLKQAVEPQFYCPLTAKPQVIAAITAAKNYRSCHVWQVASLPSAAYSNKQGHGITMNKRLDHDWGVFLYSKSPPYWGNYHKVQEEQIYRIKKAEPGKFLHCKSTGTAFSSAKRMVISRVVKSPNLTPNLERLIRGSSELDVTLQIYSYEA